MRGLASYLHGLDPRLKLAVALALGPSLWRLDIIVVGVVCFLLAGAVIPLAARQPVGTRMIRSLAVFLLVWIGVKAGLDAISGLPASMVLANAASLGLRLSTLLLLGLVLALSTSSRALGMAIAWGIRPIVGEERAWQVALSLALMVHFLPMCLTVMTQAGEQIALRCPDMSFRRKMLLIPQVVLRNLGQKTWNQTLAVAGRRLDSASAWQPDFSWGAQDWLCLLIFLVCGSALILF